MTTTVVKTIGSGGDYATLQAWYDAAPADLVAADQVWEGRILNELVVSSRALDGTTKTTDSTRRFVLTAAAGVSFRDHANKATNPLRYDGTNGVGVRGTFNYSYQRLLDLGGYWTITNLQFYGSDSQTMCINAASYNGKITMDNCIVDAEIVAMNAWSDCTFTNCVFIARNNYNSSSVYGCAVSTVINCTIVAANGSGSGCCSFAAAGSTIKNTAFFGGAIGGNIADIPNATNCYTDQTPPSGKSGWTQVSYAACFEDYSNGGTRDFRLKTGSPLIGAGTASGAPGTDIIGTVRPQDGTYDVGAWEFAGGGGGAAAHKLNLLLRVG